MFRSSNFSRATHIDYYLLSLILILIGIGQLVLYSAGASNFNLVERQIIRLVAALGIMVFIAQIPPRYYRICAPYLYACSLILLFAVLIMGHIGKGAQRWLDFGLLRFQPAELMKIACPLMIAYLISNHEVPPKNRYILLALLLIVTPALLIAKQPDLGTAVVITASGIFVLFLAGLRWRLIIVFLLSVLCILPILWHYLHDYQKQRIFTFLNPETDPLGAGYHIIQSKIAIGSGGILGKGWLHGTQSHLQFLPERTTDFIFAVLGEEFGLFGALILLIIYSLIISRGLYISMEAQDTFTRLLAGSLTLTFFVYACVNIGMVSGILPVVGLPLPLVSYGGTAMITILASFGMLMSISTHRRLWSSG